MADITPGLILLTYKGKILLMHKTNGVQDSKVHPWSLMGCIRGNKESFEDAMRAIVEKEAGIKIDNIEYISKFRYHSALTDDNINNIKRGEFQLLDFFALKDLQKLSLSPSTREFIFKSEYLINKIPI